MNTKTRKQLRVLALMLALVSVSLHAQSDHEAANSGARPEQGEDHESHSAETHADEEGHSDEDHSEEGHSEEGHSEEGAGGHEEHAPGVVEVTAEGRKLLQINTRKLQPQPVPALVHAPGEVQLNAYRSAQVTTRIPAQVVRRYATLGEAVQKGAPLVLLSSVEMAEAQGALQVAAREWERLRQLGQSVVGEGRYIEARVAFEQARSKLLAYGMTRSQVDDFLRDPGERELGEFRLLAPQAGTVLKDDFVTGQHVDAGESLFFIADESSIWVEATVPPDEARGIEVGAPARVKVGEEWHQGKVVQMQHRLNESTRTVPVRIELNFEQDHPPHPGEFVQVGVVADEGEPGLLVPERALNRNPEGRWAVFVQEAPGKYRQVEVERVKDLPGQVVIRGVESGSAVVTRGAFYLNSELAKSGFSVHNH